MEIHGDYSGLQFVVPIATQNRSFRAHRHQSCLTLFTTNQASLNRSFPHAFLALDPVAAHKGARCRMVTNAQVQKLMETVLWKIA
jgi:hypothetical protein